MRNDEIAWSALAAHRWDRIVVSPGPGRPERERDLGIGRAALAQREIPVLGVCLGHQGLAHVGGGERRARRARSSTAGSAASSIAATACSAASRRASAPCATTRSSSSRRCRRRARGARLGRRRHADGDPRPRPPRLGRAVSSRVDRHRARRAARRELHRADAAAPPPQRAAAPAAAQHGRARRPRAGAQPAARSRSPTACSTAAPDAERAFAALFGDRGAAFWLDSSLVDPALSRFSFMGAALGALGAEVRYARRGPAASRVTRGGGERERRTTRRCSTTSAASSRGCTPTSPELPFDLNGGFVGYLGYELQGRLRRRRRARAPSCPTPSCCSPTGSSRSTTRSGARTCSRCATASAGELAAARGLARRDGRRARRPAGARRAARARARARPRSRSTLRRGREHYLANIETCKRLLEAGESYEICLTNTLALPALADPFELYRVLRRVNPAPYSAYLRMREGAVLSSSPERFLRVDARPHGRGQADQGHGPPRTPSPPPTRRRATRSRAARRTAPSTS